MFKSWRDRYSVCATWLLGIVALFPVSAFAQLQLFEFDGTTETPVTSLLQVPPVASGDTVIIRFRLFNNGLGAATFSNLGLSGQDFLITSAPSIPYVIAPGSFAEFRVTFSPDAIGSYSANMLVNTIAVALRGTAEAEASLSAGTTPLTGGSTVDFGKIPFGTTTSQTFTLSNPNSTAVTISKITVTGAGFKGPIGITTPLVLPPDQAATFQIVFAPPAGQTYSAVLAIDQRTFALTGLGLDPPLPTATIQFISPSVASALQTTLTIELASASQVAGTGTLTMAFQSAVAGVTDDPAIQFLTGPLRVATVTISPGDTVAKFGTASDIVFQTGSTAGVILFTLTLGDTTQQASLAIPAAPVYLDTASGTLELGSVVVGLIGYDNTYSASQLQFTFYDTNGTALPGGLITADVTQDFESYFQTTQAGGSFQLRANFLISGDSAVLGSVSVSITNSVGVTTPQRIVF
jgi:hypothetical protein